MNLLITKPPTRINESWIKYGSSLNYLFDSSENVSNDLIKGKPNVDYRFYADFYSKIGVDVVTETVFDYPYPFITEKTYRPIASLRPFIIVGAYGTLKFLRDLNFKTFSSIIDESYDDLQDPEKRFIAVCRSIDQFVSRPLQRVKNDIQKVKDDLYFNLSQLQKLKCDELEKFKQQI
jgi:hypothetical protein